MGNSYKSKTENNSDTGDSCLDISEVTISITTCRENVKLPFYANEGDAGMDIVSAEEVVIAPGETKLISTGIKVAIPVGYEIQVRPRSGLSLNTPLRIPNSPGTIDSGFRNEVKVIMTNDSKMNLMDSDEIINLIKEPHTVSSKGNKQGSYKIMPGDRIAQIVLNRVPVIKWNIVESVEDIGTDRGGGFGSSGT